MRCFQMMHPCCPPGFVSFLSSQNQLSKNISFSTLSIEFGQSIVYMDYFSFCLILEHNRWFYFQSDPQDTSNAHRTLDLASSLEVGPATNPATGDVVSGYSARSVLTIAFQFPFEDNLQDNVATMARQYVRSVVSSVQRVAMAISPAGVNSTFGSKLSPGSPEAVTLSHWICQSYR